MESDDKTRAIVVQAFRYGDNSLITKLLTEKYGIRSFIVKGAYSKTSKFRPAFFQNATLLDVVVTPSRSELCYLKEVSVDYPYSDIPFEIKKMSIVMYMTELINKSILGAEENRPLFGYVHQSLIWLDTVKEGYANFPLAFAIGLTRYLGFYPNSDNYLPGYCFDLQEGCFFKNLDNKEYALTCNESELFYKLCLASFDEMAALALNNSTRHTLMQAVNNYYNLHVSGFKEMHSADILRNVLR